MYNIYSNGFDGNSLYILYSRARQLSPSIFSDVALICYSVDSPASLHNVTENWITEISHYCPKTPVLLIGNKLDLASDTLQTVT